MKLRIGTRGSKLALTQANAVRDHLSKINPDFEYLICEIKSDGDKWQGTNKESTKDKKKWTGVLEEALVDGKIDVVIHSAKDVPAEINTKTKITPILDRKSAFDVFIGKKVNGKRLSFASLSDGAVIGTASIRRKTQILTYNNTFKVIEHRGNVPTRIKKLDESSELSGIILAEAGLVRLGYSDSEYEVLDKEIILPAVNQGILVAQSLIENEVISNLLSAGLKEEDNIIFLAERFIVERVDASCDSAISVYANIEASKLKLNVVVIGQKSKRKIVESFTGEVSSWETIASEMLSVLKNKNVDELLNE